LKEKKDIDCVTYAKQMFSSIKKRGKYWIFIFFPHPKMLTLGMCVKVGTTPIVV